MLYKLSYYVIKHFGSQSLNWNTFKTLLWFVRIWYLNVKWQWHFDANAFYSIEGRVFNRQTKIIQWINSNIEVFGVRLGAMLRCVLLFYLRLYKFWIAKVLLFMNSYYVLIWKMWIVYIVIRILSCHNIALYANQIPTICLKLVKNIILEFDYFWIKIKEIDETN